MGAAEVKVGDSGIRSSNPEVVVAATIAPTSAECESVSPGKLPANQLALAAYLF